MAVCGTCCILLLAFSATACSDPGIVYRSVDRSSSSAAGGGVPPLGNGSSSVGNGGAQVEGQVEAGDTLCGEAIGVV